MLSPIETIFAFFVSTVPVLNIPPIVIAPEIFNIINIAWYFLPMKTIAGLAGLGFCITLVRLAIAVVIRFKSFIPTMGA